MKGGVGKTTLTTNLAIELFHRNQRVLVIDVDPQFNSTQTLMKFYEKNLQKYFTLRESNRTLTRVFAPVSRLRGVSKSHQETEKESEDSVIHSLAEKNEAKLDIIPGDMGLIVDINDAASDKFRAFIKKSHLNTKYDFILIDCPPTWGQLTSVALSTSDYYLIPTNLDEFSTIGITLLAQLLSDKVNSVDKPLKNLGVIYMFLKKNSSEDGIARDQKQFRRDIEEYFQDEMQDLVDSEVKPFDTFFYSDDYFITKSALYFTEEAKQRRPEYEKKVRDLVDEIINRIIEEER